MILSLPNRFTIPFLTGFTLISLLGCGSDSPPTSALIQANPAATFNDTLTPTDLEQVDQSATELFYDSETSTSANFQDAAIAFAISQGVSNPEQIVEFVNTVIQPVAGISIDLTNLARDPNPTLISEFDEDGIPGTVFDAAVLFAVPTGLTNDPDALEDYIRTDLALPIGELNQAMIPEPEVTAAIEGVVWDDLNEDGIRTEAEPGIPDRVIFLDADEDDVLDPEERFTTTAADGTYRFGDLTPGTYVVADQYVSGFEQTAPLASQVPIGGPPSIVGGEPADPDSWPWMVALLRASEPDPFLGQFCAGTLIHPEWVMTAAHCLVDSLVSGVAGPDDFDLLLGTNILSTGGDRVDVAEVLVFPSYEVFGDGSLTQDVALVRLPEPSDLPILPLAPANSGDFEGETATAIGWGRLAEAGGFPDELYQVDLPIISNTQCSSDLQGIFTILDVMICAGFPEGGRDTCQGDSGGPLVVAADQGGVQTVGITSFGLGCARPERPGVYTRVSSFTAWVTSQIGSGSYEVKVDPGQTVTEVNFGSQDAKVFVPPPPFQFPAPVGSIGFPDTLNGSLEVSDPVDEFNAFLDVYTLTDVEPGDLVLIELTSPEFDTFLYLVDGETSEILAFNDDSGLETDSRLRFTVEEGIPYQIGVSSFAIGEVGSYTLTTEVAPPPLPAPDVIEVSGTVDAENVILEMVFDTEILPPASGSVDAVVGFWDLDLDQNVETGEIFDDPTIGVDVFVNLFANVGEGQVSVVDPSNFIVIGLASIVYTDTSFELSIPLSLLGNDDGNINSTATVGTEAIVSDRVPDQGFVSFPGTFSDPVGDAIGEAAINAAMIRQGKVSSRQSWP